MFDTSWVLYWVLGIVSQPFTHETSSVLFRSHPQCSIVRPKDLTPYP
jgi:hypothetical protein